MAKNILIVSDPEETPRIIEMINKSACVMKRVGRLHYEYIDEGVKYEFKSLASVDLFDDDNIFTNWIMGRKFDSVFLTKHIDNKIPNTIRDMLLSSAENGDIEIEERLFEII